MGDIVYLQNKKRKKPQVVNTVRGVPVFRGQLYFEDSVADLDCVGFFTQVAMQLPTKSKQQFLKIFKQMQDFAQLVSKDGTPEMKKAMIEMGFLITGGNTDGSDQ